MPQPMNSASDWMTSGPGAKRRILCTDEILMLVEFSFETDGNADPHHHMHTQSTFVTKGKFQFTVGGETRILEPGDNLIIPSNTVHSCVCLEAGTLVDSFSPPRQDFMDAHGLELAE